MVGTGRRWPCLIVESAAGGLTPEQKSAVSETIVERTADFYKNLFPHEKIQDPKRILVVEKGTLPRTTVSALALYVFHLAHADDCGACTGEGQCAVRIAFASIIAH